MLHISLYWYEYGIDDLALWPYAVKYATWLYNLVPNRIMGLTSIELFTKTHSDHCDLLKTHVW